LTNVIPVIGKSDLFDGAETAERKLAILKALQTASHKPFTFGTSLDEIIDLQTEKASNKRLLEPSEPEPESEPKLVASSDATKSALEDTPKPDSTEESTPNATISPPFAISSAHMTDVHEMDASLLMSPAYTPPLIESELSALVQQLFDAETMSWLRHNSARKFLAWRERQLAVALADPARELDMGTGKDPLKRMRLQAMKDTSSLGNLYSLGQGQPFSLHLPADVSVLDAMPRQERARWLLERINEEVAAGNLGVMSEAHTQSSNSLQSAITLTAPKPSRKHHSGISKHHRAGHRPPAASRCKTITDADLPAWARAGEPRVRARSVDPSDPLGLCGAWDGWSRVFAWGVGGGVVVGAVWVVVVKGWVNVWGMRLGGE
jgi:hypothetical protein